MDWTLQRQHHDMTAFFRGVNYVPPPFDSTFLGQNYEGEDEEDNSYAPSSSPDEADFEDAVDEDPMDVEDDEEDDDSYAPSFSNSCIKIYRRRTHDRFTLKRLRLDAIESKIFHFQVSDVISVTQSKNGKGHSLTISSCTAVWLIEALNHPPLAREGWNITRYEDQSATKFSWESNSFGSFVKISSGNEKNLKHLFIPVGFNSEGIKLFVNTLIEVDFETGTRLVDEGWKCSSNCLPTGMLEEESKESGYKHLVDSLMEKELEHRKHIPDEVPHIDQESLKIIDQVIRDNRNLFRRSVANKRFFESLNKGEIISFSGEAIMVTRESMKSSEFIDAATFQGAKYPVFLAYAKQDMQAVLNHLCGVQE
ncbi:unnamed protein product [Cuscuta campestris]|uniref:Uncharacterized protein n=1 Tax=Cuscuta campestris TaxID=132261 RepID=A0A484LUN7_9ASTE|nr:unnamed protein product [Cuscuta campestris]